MAQSFQLAEPLMFSDRVFFYEKCSVELVFEMDGSEVRYTLDGSEPTLESKRYTHPIKLKKTTTVKARCFHPDFLPSEIAKLHVFKSQQIATCNLITWNDPDPAYEAPMEALVDRKKGDMNLKSGAWLGFRQEDFVSEWGFRQPPRAKYLLVGSMVNTASWIFPPQRIELTCIDERWKPFQLGVLAPDELENALPVYQIPLIPSNCTKMRLTIEHYGMLPEDHPGAGSRAWLFIDEIGLGW
jgi:hypothetical protein